MKSTEQILGYIRSAVREETRKREPQTRLAVIDANYLSGRPRIRFEGEAASGQKHYPYLSSYTPAAGDRVVVARVGTSWVVMGKIV